MLAVAIAVDQPPRAASARPAQQEATPPAPQTSGAPNAVPSPGATAPAAPAASATLPAVGPSTEPTFASKPGTAPSRAPSRPRRSPRSRVAGSQPTPFPQYTLGPASQPTSLAFPAYGTPAPGVGIGPTPDPREAAPKLTLPEAIAIAYARSPLLAMARADVGLAKAAKRLAQTGYLPNINLSASTAHSNRQGGGGNFSTGTGVGGTGGTGVGNLGGFSSGSSTTSNSFDLSLQQTIFDGFRIAYQIRAASLADTAAADTYKRELQTIAFNIATAYYNSLFAQRATGVAVETVRLDQVQEDLVRAQIRAGTAARADLSTAQLPTAQARVAVVRDQANELSAQAVFANALGLDADVNVLPVDDTPLNALGNISTIAVPGYDLALGRAYALRPDFASSERTLESAQASLRAARAQFLPALTGAASLGDSSSDLTGGSFRNSNTLSATLTIPLFNSGVTLADIDQSKAQIDLDTALLEQVREGVQLNVKQTLVNLIAARQALDQAQAEDLKANDVVRSTQAQYRAGVTTLPLLLNAQVGLTTALTDQVSAIYTLRQAEQAYLYAVGSNTP